ncbi:di-trans,poly-cis-decaprenylcistransferase [Oribacterium sp. C9]|uniref:isoprenyl transferase n=1 Tax=Oribacterium sp. C9 TaxID=1943579 RepID=UPI00099010F3|nr:isoprenyl transferase [Oribacterium sp. C9]OON85453.1 di-trans,poly-cis-decaprenylcistransferase [Oribacterium sp. C9]
MENINDIIDNEGRNIPDHIAIILDGNGRWAERKGLPRALGHKQGCETLEAIIGDCAKLGVKYLTVYGFSTENWKRSAEEVGALMKLFRFYITKLLKVANEHNVRLRMIGERSRFDADIQEGIETLEEKTKDNTGMTFVFAVNYGSRDEIVRAVRKYTLEALRSGKTEEEIEALTEQEFSAYLDTAGMPDPDLVIRSSGEFRISNYLLWQSAYTEYYITPVLWPDFNKAELLKAIDDFNGRERRFGGRLKK